MKKEGEHWLGGSLLDARHPPVEQPTV